MKDPTKLEYYKRDLELRAAELEHSIAAAEQEARTLATKPADVLDQAALEQDKQLVLRRIAADQQLRTNLIQALERIRKGHFGECVNCGSEIETNRLEAIPWARYCIRCQEAAEHRSRQLAS